MAGTPTFQPGDVVQLNSGGPLMTVFKLITEGKYLQCYYVDATGKIQEHPTHFLAAAFQKATPPQPA